MKIGIVVFPGSNCDHDCAYVFKDVLGQSVEMIWHKATLLAGLDAIVLPGGFSYGAGSASHLENRYPYPAAG